MSKLFGYIHHILADSKGSPSSKRWIAMICFLMIIGSWSADLFYHLTSTEYIFDSLIYLVVGCLGITGIEKFASQ